MINLTTEQKECGHEWDEWDADLNQAEIQCQFCHTTLEDYVTYLEAENTRLQSELDAARKTKGVE